MKTVREESVMWALFALSMVKLSPKDCQDKVCLCGLILDIGSLGN